MPKRKPNKVLPAQEILQAAFIYDPLTGILIRSSGHFAGKRAGWIDKDGHRRIQIGKAYYMAHRIIWKLVTGEEPPATLDHRDGDGDDNRWETLRTATQQQQIWNRRVRGVSRMGKKWRARLRKDGVTRYLGVFDTEAEAMVARDKAAREAFGEFYR